jgi:hypothetical protein
MSSGMSSSLTDGHLWGPEPLVGVDRDGTIPGDSDRGEAGVDRAVALSSDSGRTVAVPEDSGPAGRGARTVGRNFRKISATPG